MFNIKELKSGLPKVCVPLLPRNFDELKQELDVLNDVYYDIIEWRIDYYDDVENTNVLLETLNYIRTQLPKCTLLVTFRTIFEGGNKITEHYQDIYQLLIKSNKIDLLDIEFSRGDGLFLDLLSLAHQHNVYVVASYHDFSSTPSKQEMMFKFEKMATLQADIFKLAVMPRNVEDVLRLLEVTYLANSKYKQPIVTMSMSKLGFISRMSGELFGSAITFGSSKEASAPGQISANDLHDLLQLVHKGL